MEGKVSLSGVGLMSKHAVTNATIAHDAPSAKAPEYPKGERHMYEVQRTQGLAFVELMWHTWGTNLSGQKCGVVCVREVSGGENSTRGKPARRLEAKIPLEENHPGDWRVIY
jgi:hypothetical protein